MTSSPSTKARLRPLPPPLHRPLKVYAFDPSRGRHLGNHLTIPVEYEPLRPGPIGQRVAVIDYDTTFDHFYEPVDLDHPDILISGGLSPNEGDPRFHQQMAYAVVNETVRAFESALGRAIEWRKRDSARVNNPRLSRQLLVFPHAVNEANAFYDRGTQSLSFGYFISLAKDDEGSLPGQTIFTCLSHDVLAHETAHAIIDLLHPNYIYPTNPDVAAFHEGFADLAALFRHFSYKEALLDTIQRTGGVLYRDRLRPDSPPSPTGPTIQSEVSEDNPLVQLARQFGGGRGMRGALRHALGHKADPSLLETVTEPHERGSILVAAVFDAFFSLYVRSTADLFRIYRLGGGSPNPVDLPAPLAERLANEASEIAEDVFGMCVRALDYMPLVDPTFGDFLRGIVTADWEVDREDKHGYRDAFMQAFRAHGIRPEGVYSFAEEALRWPRDPALPACRGLRIRLTGARDLSNADKEVNKEVLAKYAFAHLAFDPDWKDDTWDSTLRPLHRIGFDGILRPGSVVEIIQRKAVSYAPHDARESFYPYVGGATLILEHQGPDRVGKVRYALMKPLLNDEGREAAQRRRFQELGLLDHEASMTNDAQFCLDFAAIHRGVR